MAGKSENAAAPGRRDPEERRRLLAAMLEVTGEVGYRRTTIDLVAQRTDTSVGQFYSYFVDRGDCFLAAYEATAGALLASMFGAAGRASSWRGAIRAALTELSIFATESPVTATALLAEVYVAGGPSLTRHEQNLRRLSDAVAGTRRETHPSRHDPPPMTAVFIVGALEEVVRRRLAEGQAELLWDDLPELVALAVGAYLDDDAAAQERRRPSDRPGTS